jgi:hypothetical protein
VYCGGELRGGSPGRGSENKTPFVAAVSINKSGHLIAMNFNIVKGFTSKEIERWARSHIVTGSVVHSDELNCFPAVTKAGSEHIPLVTGDGAESVEKPEFIWVNTMIGNVKNALVGS